MLNLTFLKQQPMEPEPFRRLAGDGSRKKRQPTHACRLFAGDDPCHLSQYIRQVHESQVHIPIERIFFINHKKHLDFIRNN